MQYAIVFILAIIIGFIDGYKYTFILASYVFMFLCSVLISALLVGLWENTWPDFWTVFLVWQIPYTVSRLLGWTNKPSSTRYF